jgi:hypothetical protein
MRFDRDALRWTVPGALTGVAFLGLFSIGVLLLPVVALLVYWAGRATEGHGGYGFLVGAGLAIAAICLPQGVYAGLGSFGLGVASIGVALCLARHHRAASD